jgi:putative phosphonate metabolism protein
MATIPRYAIYYIPPAGSALDRFGAELLGYDARSGSEVGFPDEVLQMAPDWRDLTRDARRYGFHATLKAPFALASGKTEAELVVACEEFAEAPRPIPVIQPVVESIDGFIAVMPSEPSVELELLAADCTRDFDPFRAPLTPEDRARRNPAKLTPKQRERLERWGYPYVMEDFRFHMTLTCRLAAARREPVLAMLQSRFSDIGLDMLAINRIALFRQENAESRFRVINHWKLRG